MIATQAVLFDLDGTLADTAPDLGAALNRQRERRGLPPLPIAQVRPLASAGARGLLAAGFGLHPGDAEFEPMREEFLGLYRERLCEYTQLFPGVAELLDQLERRGLPWGVVTNKPQRFTLPLLEALELAGRVACVVSGDTTPQPKPHPGPLLAAAAQLAVAPAACIYLGDDERDTRASLAAGMRSVVACYGYLGDGRPWHEWGADAGIERPQDLLGLL